MLKPVVTNSLQDLVYDQLSDALMTGAFWPGETLNLNELAQVFGTSLMPVRDAVRRLAAEEALVVEPQRGVRIRQHTAAEFEEMIRIRVFLESDITAAAVSKLTEKQLAQVAKMLDEMEKAEASGEAQTYLQLNAKLFFSIYEVADRPVALRLIRSLWRQVGPILSIYVSCDGFAKTADLSRAFLKALVTRDSVTASQLRIEQIRRPSSVLLAQFDDISRLPRPRTQDLSLMSRLPAEVIPEGNSKRPGRPNQTVRKRS